MKWAGSLFAVLAVLATVAFIGVGPAFLGYGLLQIRQASAATAWPAVTGKLTSCELRSRRSSKSTTHRCRVSYVFQVEGNTYQGDRIAFGYHATNKRKTHDALHNRLKDAKRVKVFYNPHNPSESVLAPGVFRSAYVSVTFGGTWLAFCLGVGALILLDGTLAALPERIVVFN